jgi:hypothetical protein
MGEREKSWKAWMLEGWKAINSPPASGFALRAYVFADATPHRTTRQVAQVRRLNTYRCLLRRFQWDKLFFFATPVK